MLSINLYWTSFRVQAHLSEICINHISNCHTPTRISEINFEISTVNKNEPKSKYSENREHTQVFPGSSRQHKSSFIYELLLY